MAKSALDSQLLSEARGKRRSQVTYSTGTASVVRRTSTAEPSGSLPVFRTRKRNVRSSCGRASKLACNAVKTHAQVVERQALEEMFVASRSKFVAIAYSILRNKEDAEDAVQNAFLSGYRHFRSFQGRSALRTWFTRIVLNASLMIRRKRKRSAITLSPQDSDSHVVNWIETIRASQPDPETAHAEQETFDFINGILGKMRPVLREAITVTYFDELSGSEACAFLGVSPSTFKSRLSRARQGLLNHAQRAFPAPNYGTTPSGARILENVNYSKSAGT